MNAGMHTMNLFAIYSSFQNKYCLNRVSMNIFPVKSSTKVYSELLLSSFMISLTSFQHSHFNFVFIYLKNMFRFAILCFLPILGNSSSDHPRPSQTGRNWIKNLTQTLCPNIIVWSLINKNTLSSFLCSRTTTKLSSKSFKVLIDLFSWIWGNPSIICALFRVARGKSAFGSHFTQASHSKKYFYLGHCHISWWRHEGKNN